MDSDVQYGKKKCGKFWRMLQAVKHNTAEFCRSTSLHGLQYVGEPHRPMYERLFWFLTFVLSTGVVTFFILKVWKKWESTPVFVSFAETTTPVWDIPFPAVTICPEIKVRETVFNYTEIYFRKNRTAEETGMLEKSQLVCRSMINFGFYFHLLEETSENSSTVEGMDDFFEEVSPTLDDSMFLCHWRGDKFTECDDLFKPILTDDGLCFSFNMLNNKELFRAGIVQRDNKYQHPNISLWTFDKGYSDTESTSVYPMRSMRSGARGGLSLFLMFNAQDLGTLCNLATDGVKVVVHNPTDLPSIHDNYFRVNMDNDVVVGIKPRVMTTSDTLRSYPPKRRQCYYATERQLHYFNKYTEDNCELECFTNYTLELCDCVTFFMPRRENVSVCGVANQMCTEIATDLFMADDKGLAKCDCMPSCVDIRYDVETSQANSNISKSLIDILHAIKLSSPPLTDFKLSKLSLYYKDGQFVTSIRSELYGPADFLASCGGLLGLYLGFSLLSLVEIVYFFTIRLISNLRIHRKQSKHP